MTGSIPHDPGPPEEREPRVAPGESPGLTTERRDERGRAASLAAAALRGTRWGVRGTRQGISLIVDRIVEMAPRVPVRDLETLRRQFPGLGPEEIADKLVAGAARGTAAVGAAVGAAVMMPVPPAMPAELAAEIVGVAAVELKLIAELHEIYGVRASGGPRERGMAHLAAWSGERGIDLADPLTVNAALSSQMKRELRQRILRRGVRNLPNLAPFMVGAGVGAVMNRRGTRRLADKIRADLRARQVTWAALPEVQEGQAPEDAGKPHHPRQLPE